MSYFLIVIISNFQPVLFVHGALSRAAIFLRHREYFIYRGYSWSELYATTYGNGINSAIFDGVHCSYIKQVDKNNSASSH